MKKIFIILVLTIIGLNAWAYDFSVGGIYYNYYGSGSVEVTSQTSFGSSYSGNIIIPLTVTYNETTYNVTSIGDYAFYGCTGLTSITIPNSVSSIGQAAFFTCYGLTSITIPNSVTSIGNSAFSHCYGLTSITIPNSVTSIGGFAFAGCSGLSSITIPNSVTSIGGRAFNYCSSLTSINVDNNNQYYESLDGILYTEQIDTLICCPSGKTGSFTIPNSVTYISNFAFENCSGLTSITIPNSVTYIEGAVFSGCSSLTSINVDNNNQYYKSLDGILYTKQIDILICCPGGKVGVVTIPNSVIYIWDFAFYGCSGLTSITIPNSVTYIGSAAFRDCSGLTSIISLAIIPPPINNYTFSGLTLSSIHLYVPCGNLSAYQNADYWSDFTNISELNFINREVTICQGNPYFFAGDTLTQAGIYYDTLQSVNGCDSIVTLTLNVNPTFNDTITATIQPGETYSENGFNESQEGIYTQELQSMNSCDSIVVLVLHVEASLNTVSGKNINVALYPNPANNKTKLEVEGLDSDADITIYDIQGRVLKRMKLKESEREVNIDLTGLIKGIYQVRIINNNFNITKKLIVN